MSSVDDAAASTSQWLNALVPVIAWLMLKSPEDYAYAKRNTDDCWYAPTCAVMTDLIPRLTTKDLEYNKANAIADADAAINTLFTEFKDDSLAQVYQPQCIANGYNSTTMQLLANNAYAKTVSEGAKIQLDNIARYAGIRVNDLNVMAQLINAIKGSYGVGNISESYNMNLTNAINGMAQIGTSAYDAVVRPEVKAG